MESHLKPLFGSQLINSTSKTPYSDATQVRGITKFVFIFFFASQLIRVDTSSSSFPFHQQSSSSRSALNLSSKRIFFLLACATYWEWWGRERGRCDGIKSDYCAGVHRKKVSFRIFLKLFSSGGFSNSKLEKRTQLITHTNAFETSFKLVSIWFFFHFHSPYVLAGFD